ncbi:MAG: PepSY-associated helix domain protein, partial [Mycobacterium sp.]|nr:PepSY-associated helix domain protein [Mycobacterium sp.]
RLVGRPPARGVLRRTHFGVVALVVVAAIAVGWFLPLLGVSLVAFLVLDVAIGRVRALRQR